MYSEEFDLAFAASMQELFRDPRYIRINGRPLLMVYRPVLIPNARETFARWRKYFNTIGENDPYLVMPQMDGDDDPLVYQMDAAAGFPPHRVGWRERQVPLETLNQFDAAYNGNVVAYERMARTALNNRSTKFKLFPGVCPSWDNEARKPGRGYCFLGGNPELYQKWLLRSCQVVASEARTPDERIVFINAWNEWAEGAYLEPDRHYGYAFLVATANALRQARQQSESGAVPSDLLSEGIASVEPADHQWKPQFRRKFRQFGGFVADIFEGVARRCRQI